MKHLFLDLEDTVITPVVGNWSDSELINIESTKEVIREFKPAAVSLFSFALHNVHELTAFTRDIRHHLEDALGVRLFLTPTMDDLIIPTCARALGWHPSRVDFNDMVMLGKQITFKLFVMELAKKQQKGLDVILMDDTVFNETWCWPDMGVTGRIIRV